MGPLSQWSKKQGSHVSDTKVVTSVTSVKPRGNSWYKDVFQDLFLNSERKWWDFALGAWLCWLL